MSKEFSNKINLLAKRQNKSQSLFAKTYNIKLGTVNTWYVGRVQPNFEILKKFSEFYNVTIDYLLDNEVYGFEESDVKMKRIPVLNYVQAGNLTDINENFYDEYIPVSDDISSQCFALRIKGKSMEPYYIENDMVIVDPTLLPTSGDLVIATTEHDEKATFKKYKERFDENGQMYFELEPFNKDYPTFNSKQFKINIKGVVIAFNRTIK